MSSEDRASSFDTPGFLAGVSLDQLLPALPVAALVLDGDLIVRAWNPAFESLFGYRPADLEGRALEDIFEAAVEEAPQHHPGRERRPETSSRRTRSGHWIEVRILAIPLSEASRKPAMLCLYLDSPRRQSVEATPQAPEERQSALWEGWPHGAFRATADGRIVAANSALRTLLGYDAPHQLTDLLTEPSSYADPADCAPLLEQLKAGEEIEAREIALRRRDGATVHVSLTARPVRDEEDRFLHFQGTLTDVTEHRRASVLGDRLGRILDQSDNEIYLFEAETFRFVQANRGALHNLGYTFEELARLHPWEFQVGLDRDSYRDFAERLAEGRQTMLSFETTHRRKDGSTYPVEIRLQLMARENPAIFVALGQDVTDDHRLAEQLRLSQRMEAVGVLAGGLAHDFNNLLTAIKGHAELALDRRGGADWPDEHFRVIVHAADRGAELTRQVLAFSRQQMLRPRIVLLNEVVTNLEPLLKSTLGEDVRLEVHLDSEIGWTRVDPGQMEEILINLAINSRHSMPSGGSFFIETRNERLEGFTIEGRIPVDPGRYVVLSVRDTGLGMDEETRRRAFEPFFTTKGSEGSGLGLAMIYGIVKQSGGYIWLESAPGQGTTCTICLPRVAPASQPDEEEPASDAPRVGGTETILLVEDEELVRDLVRVSLEAEGYNVLAAATAEEALADHADDEAIQLLISDVVLPGMAGTELVRRFAKRRPEIKALLVSGYAGRKLQQEGLDTLGVPLLEKPFTPDELRRAIRETLDAPDLPSPS